MSHLLVHFVDSFQYQKVVILLTKTCERLVFLLLVLSPALLIKILEFVVDQAKSQENSTKILIARYINCSLIACV